MRFTLHKRLSSSLILSASIAVSCQKLPPALTGVTLAPSTSDGTPELSAVARTAIGPPIPLIAVRPGAEPLRSALFLNEPRSGAIAITLGRGKQSFSLFTLADEPHSEYVVALFLDGETSPSISALLRAGTTAPLQPSRAATIASLDGTAIANSSTLTTVRDGYRVTLNAARFPISDLHADVANPWALLPDNVVDAVGTISLDVEPIATLP